MPCALSCVRRLQGLRPVALRTLLALCVIHGVFNLPVSVSVAALPPPEDTPEEVLRNRPTFDARSPVDGQPLSAAEYARLQTELQALEANPPLSANVQQTIFLLRILRAVRVLTPL